MGVEEKYTQRFGEKAKGNKSLGRHKSLDWRIILK
jgi:hypothetical protein